MAVKAVLFDNDGTLVDTYDLILESFRYAAGKVLGAVPPEEVLMAKVGQPLAVQMRDFTDDAALQEEMLAVYRAYNETIHDQRVALFDGVADGLARLAEAGLALGVVTSKRHGLASRGLEVLGVRQRFAVLVGSDDLPLFKPDPAPVRLGCDVLGASPDECLYVGDSPFDIQAGNGAGCRTVAALWGMFSAERLAQEHPTYSCATFADMVDVALGLARC